MKKADVIGNRTRTIERTYRIILGKEKQVFKRNKSATPKERSSDQFSSDWDFWLLKKPIMFLYRVYLYGIKNNHN